MTSPVMDLLAELVRIPSVNPAFVDVPRELTGEARMVADMTERLTAAGFEVTCEEVLPGRCNVWARRGRPGPALVLCAHLDTVPGEGMVGDPFSGEIRDGAVYGRGSLDTKGSMAAMLMAALTVVDDTPLAFLLTCDEESGFAGSRAAAASPPGEITGVIIGEPTSNKVVTAHKGAWRTVVRTEGVAAHSSMPHLGVNAIYRMTPVLAALEKLSEEVAARAPHPMLGAPTMSVGTLHGGTAVNSVPDVCRVEFDRRVLPGESAEDIDAEVATALAGLEGVVIEPPFFEVPAFSIEEDHPYRCFVGETLSVDTDNVAPYATDASILMEAGMPCVVLGPGEAGKAHTRDEYLSGEELDEAVANYCRLIEAFGED